MNCIPKEFIPDNEVTKELQEDIEMYVNQGGLLGVFTYFLIYLQNQDDDLAAKAATIPTYLFVMSSLHDDAIDGANTRNRTLKQFLNQRTTWGDMAFTHVLDLATELPEEFETQAITNQFRKIGKGQLREDSITNSSLSLDEAVTRVEERGSVWGELAISPVEAAGYYQDHQLNHVYTFTANLLFILTVVDDVEDIPEDLENEVVNIPLILHDTNLAEYPSRQAFVNEILESDVPQRLDQLISTYEAEMEEGARQFFEAIPHSQVDLLTAWNQALSWYSESVCTVPVKENVSPSKQDEVHQKLSSNNKAKRESIINQLIREFPARFQTQDDFVNAATSLPPNRLAPAAIIMLHIEDLVESVMTTNLEDALSNLRKESPIPT